ncbi:hypothetical protein HGRIS_006697 [Hohenbuehelia grisea]|uniref:Ubiquinol-cytochrome C reductase hinge domain-containing protein n=1 Tax=Hohenbuehelia grisea TaxID=104357 RepID=A0ABR3J9U1_9AGAR
MGLADLFSSFLPTVNADAPEEQNQVANTSEQEESKQEEPPAEEEEEEEPEDELPAVREECQTGKCASLTKHFEHCQEKVNAGNGFKGEDCVEELCTFLAFITRFRH